MPRKNKPTIGLEGGSGSESERSPFFSIIVPAYNVEEYIAECIGSILNQNFQDFELILVDDGSTDQTGEICEKFLKEFKKVGASRFSGSSKKSKNLETPKKQTQPTIIPQISEKVNGNSEQIEQIIVIHQENGGLSNARNAGVELAHGEYLIFLDGDDYLEPQALAKMKTGIEPGLDLLRYQAQEAFIDEQNIKNEHNAEAKEATNSKNTLRIVEHPEPGFVKMPGVKAFPILAKYHYTENAWLYCYRREFFVQNNFRYAEGCIAEDFGLTPLIIAKAQSVKAIPNICYSYRQREGSIMHSAEKNARRVADIEKQLAIILPKIAEIHGAEAILHYLVVSFLTEAARQGKVDFLEIYKKAKKRGWLKYIHPGSLRAVLRAMLLKYFPSVFCRVYGKS